MAKVAVLKKLTNQYRQQSRSDYKGYNSDYYKSTAPLNSKANLHGAKAIAPPKRRKAKNGVFENEQRSGLHK